MKLPTRRWWPGPSLLRRVVFTLLWAFLLVWLALLARDYIAFKRVDAHRQLLRSAAALEVSLREAGTAHDAALTVRVTEGLYNRSRRESGLDGVGDLLFVLTDTATGERAYASQALSTIAALPGGVGEPRPVEIAGRAHWSAVRQTPRWRLAVFEPVVRDASVLRWLAADQLAPMLVAFPFVLLPLCLAVWRGLAPLREFSARVAARDPSDVSGLGFELRHAELKPLMGAFEMLLGKARQGIDRERAFVQDAAHELRTPLAVVTAQAHALAVAAGPRARRDAKAALERAVGRASHLVHQLLTLSRVEGAPRVRAADLVEVTRQVLIAAAPEAAERGIEVSLDCPERLDARADVESFFTIVDNLLRNALAYCPPGAQVALTLEASGHRVRLAVLDDGPGIAAQDAPHLFERFRRGRDVRSPGSGLGLAIVRQAAQSMGGTVAHGQGIGGQGAGFVVDIPFGSGAPAGA